MSEAEKLRSLLAEARDALYPLSLSADGFAEMRQRIDAALAEPVVASRMEKPSNTTWARFAYDFRERAEKAERERDSARAEVERLKTALAGAENSIKAHNEHEERLRSEASELAQEAYQRGAEAMREEAARKLQNSIEAVDGFLPDHTTELLQRIQSRIRALRLPEDRP